jgi:predicted kinase
MKSELILLCGIPRTGKTTWRNKQDLSEYVVVSPDEIRKNIFGHQYFEEANGMVFSVAEIMTRILLMQNKKVIIDATNISVGLRNKWIKIGEKCKSKIKIVVVLADEDLDKNLKIALKRNKKSKKDERLPEDALIKMNDFFSLPLKEECEDIEYFINKEV